MQKKFIVFPILILIVITPLAFSFPLSDYEISKTLNIGETKTYPVARVWNEGETDVIFVASWTGNNSNIQIIEFLYRNASSTQTETVMIATAKGDTPTVIPVSTFPMHLQPDKSEEILVKIKGVSLGTCNGNVEISKMVPTTSGMKAEESASSRATFTVESAEPNTPNPPSNPITTPVIEGSPWLYGSILAIAVVSIGFAFYMRRRRMPKLSSLLKPSMPSAKSSTLEETLKNDSLQSNIPNKCSVCGAPLESNECKYCGNKL